MSHEDFSKKILTKNIKIWYEKIVRFGKRNTIHLPKAIVEEIGIKEGDMLVLVYDKEKIELDH